ncbi:MAG: DUF1570 domain-containing protein [Candidatus Brocadiae bacterium]|nr:DUF1570 domain-containing protein [Candidatus Brocadiia bacterium]
MSPGGRNPAPAAAKNNTLLFAGIGGGALLLIVIVAALVMNKGGDAKGKGSSGKGETAADARFEKLKALREDSAQYAYEYAEECEKRADRAQAEEYYLKAVKLDPNHDFAQRKLQSWWDEIKKPACNGDLAKLTEGLAWLEKAKLEATRTTLAEWLVKQDPENSTARKILGHEQFDGKWYTADEMDLVKVAAAKRVEHAEYDKLTPRGKKVFSLKNDYEKSFGEKKKHFQDCGPDAPYLLLCEDSPNYSADLVLGDFKGVVKTLYDLFFQRYSKLFDVQSFGENEVCFIYIFESRQRYIESTGAPYFAGGHFDTQKGQIFIYMDTPDKYETIFHEGIHQLVHTISQMKVEKLTERRNVNMFWFTEGIATFFEGFKRDAQGGFILGEISQKYLPTAKQLVTTGKHMKLTEIMKLSYVDFSRRSGDPKFVMNMYSQSWSIVYFLYKFDGGKYKDKFETYYKSEVAQKGSFDAAKAAFGDLDQLNKEYEEFVKNLK